jgi:hypothetical protein
VAGNPVWIFGLEVTPEGGSAYAGATARGRLVDGDGLYGDGTSLACRIDLAGQEKIAFGEKPLM